MDLVTFLITVFNSDYLKFRHQILNYMQIISSILVNHFLFIKIFPNIKIFEDFKLFFFSGNIILYLLFLVLTITIIFNILIPSALFLLELLFKQRKMIKVNDYLKSNEIQSQDIEELINHMRGKFIIKLITLLNISKSDFINKDFDFDKIRIVFVKIFGFLVQIFLLCLFYLNQNKTIVCFGLCIIIILLVWVYLKLVHTFDLKRTVINNTEFLKHL